MTRPLKSNRFPFVVCTLTLVIATASRAERLDLPDRTTRKCLAILQEALESDEFWPSIHAAEALTLAGKGNEVIERLEPRIEHEEDAQHLCGLAREVVRAGDRSHVADLLDVLESEDPHGHVHACESLYKVGEIGDGRALRRAFAQDENRTMKTMAAGALTKWGNLDAFSYLRDEILSENPEEARIAAWILGRIGESSDIPLLRQAAERFDDELTLAYFHHALAALGDTEGQSKLLENLSHEDPAIRTYAATFAGDARMVSAKEPLIAMLDDDHLDARVRASQSLLALASPPPPDPSEIVVRDVYPATEKNPRYSEGSIIQLTDGRLLFAITEFFASNSDFATARIVARESEDQGRTWGPARVLQENIGKRNVMSVTLRRLSHPTWGGTPIGLFYLVKNAFDDLQVYLRISNDEGENFGDPIPVTSAPGYHVMNNDRIALLSGGRLLAPLASTSDVSKVNHFVSHCAYSDDGGQHWQTGEGHADYALRGAMEPEVIELEDGRILMILRTQLGHIAACHSEDDGETWTEPKSWGVRAPEAPSTLRRIPSTGDLVLVWNDTFVPGADHSGKRTPLTAAVSTDEGRTWRFRRNLETDPNLGFSYPSLIFADGRAVLSYYVHDLETGRISNRFRSLPIHWFYEED